MILDELVLHDFGVYGGRQTLKLTPAAPDQPIILVGGLNGGGKTTLLEGLQLCLFGSAAPALERMPGGYLDHLRKRIHRAAGVQSAAVELAFRHTSNGIEHAYRAVRSWEVSGNSCREFFEVLRDGQLDKLATENWAEQVEEFMPARIASLFLFDGEKVESYADPEEAPSLVATAVHNLLGLDVVERLSGDLSTLERRRRAERPGEASASPAEPVRIELATLRERRLRLQRDLAAGNDAIDRATRELKRVDERFRREGGGLYERRGAIEAEAHAADRRLADAEHSVREAAGGVAPLLLVADLMSAVRKRDLAEREIATARQMAAALGDEHAAILALPSISNLPLAEVELIEEALAHRRASHARRGSEPTHLDLTPDASAMLSGLVKNGLGEVRRQVEGAVRRAKAAHSQQINAARALQAIPTVSIVAELQDQRVALQAQVARLQAGQKVFDAELATLDRDIEQLREREARLAEQEAMARYKAQDTDRMLANSARVRQTLLRFREAVIARHVGRIEQLVLESFHSLVRKPELVSRLAIDPNSFKLTIGGGDGRELGPDQLSAGERQLLAVAMLWGMAKASGRPLPTVIDTPLGRLDSEHRSRLVERYFPHASHQVILLSTDEEISGGYHEALRPWIGRSYRLEFNSETRRTVIEDGYLPDGGLRRVA
jgi:DNA sulfur modification protein DndD